MRHIIAIGIFCTLTPVVVLSSENDPVGHLHGIVFDTQTNLPLNGIDLIIDKATIATTNRDGGIQVALSPGRHEVSLRDGELIVRSTQPIEILADETTEVIFDFDRQRRSLQMDIESAGATDQPSVSPPGDQPVQSAIRGRVIEEASRDGVPGVRIFVRGLAVEARTVADGSFVIAVPIGVHDLSAVHPEFGTMTKSGIQVTADEPAEIELEAIPIGVELEAVSVTAPRIVGSTVDILDERQESGTVSELIGAEQMSKSGDSDAAAALKRVTGITIVGGKYVYVRGMGDRYSASLLNRLNLPSPEPERRVVPLDMFPAGILDSMVIQKTYSPEMPGEFGGGVVELRTRGYPKAFLFNVKLGGTINTGTTFTDGLVGVDSGALDWLGIDNDHRGIPGAFEQATADTPLEQCNMFVTENCYDLDELYQISRGLPNNWGTHRQRLIPDFDLNTTLGTSLRFDELVVGFLTSLLYKNEWDRREKETTDYTVGAGGELEESNRYSFDTTSNEITLGGILAVGIDYGENHSLRLNTVLDRITDNEARQYWGYSTDINNDIQLTRLAWTERVLFSQQVFGRHIFESLRDFQLDYRYAYSRATRDEPDKREIRYDWSEARERWEFNAGRPDGNYRNFISVQDAAHDVGLDLSYPFAQWSGERARVKIGSAVMLKNRELDTRRFRYKSRGALVNDPEFLALSPEEIFAHEHIGEDGFVLQEGTLETDNFLAHQKVIAGYGMIDFPLGLGFRLVGGLRIERSIQQVETFELFNPDQVPVESELKTRDSLPAATLSYELLENMVLRVGYAKTANRPDFREMSPLKIVDVSGEAAVTGNTELKRAKIHNLDLRWEWYPRSGESVSIAGFYKKFLNPIEITVVPSTETVITFENAPGAYNWGLELDVRKGFDFVHRRLADLYVAGNVTWIYSSVDLPEEGIHTSKERPLQGQSPYIFNFQIGYDNVDTGTSVAALYNVYGKRIDQVGKQKAPDVYEQPFHLFDVVAKQSLKWGLKIGLKAKNLLDLPIEFTQGGKTISTYRRGRSVGLSVEWSY